MLGSPKAQQGEVRARETSEREREKEAGRGRLRRAHRGGGGRSRREEEAGGGGGRSGPLAGSCSSQSGRLLAARDPQGANKAAGAPGRPLPPRRPRHAGPEPAPPHPRRPAQEDGRSGEDRAGGWPQAGSGFATARGLVCPRLDPPPRIVSFPPKWMRGGGSPGEPRSMTGGTGTELIVGRGRVHRRVLGFRKCASSNLHCAPRQGKASTERTPGPSRS